MENIYYGLSGFKGSNSDDDIGFDFSDYKLPEDNNDDDDNEYEITDADILADAQKSWDKIDENAPGFWTTKEGQKIINNADSIKDEDGNNYVESFGNSASSFLKDSFKVLGGITSGLIKATPEFLKAYATLQSVKAMTNSKSNTQALKNAEAKINRLIIENRAIANVANVANVDKNNTAQSSAMEQYKKYIPYAVGGVLLVWALKKL